MLNIYTSNCPHECSVTIMGISSLHVGSQARDDYYSCAGNTGLSFAQLGSLNRR